MSAGAIAASVAAPILGGLAGQYMSRGDRASQEAYIQNAMNYIRNAIPPDPEDQKVFFQELKQQGVLTPELEQAVQMEGTALEDVDVDPRLKEAQMGALAQLQDVSEDGMTVEDEAALNAIQADAAQKERSNREAIESSMRQRGIMGGGQELAMKLQAAQDAASQNSQAGLDIAAQAQRRALQAIADKGDLAGSIRRQDYRQEADLAQARDAINQFNTNMRADVQQRNIARQNNAQASNLDEQQRIYEMNQSLGRQQQKHNNVDVYQQDYANRMDRARAMAGQSNNLSNYYGQKADRTAAMYSGIGQGVGQGVNSYNKNQMLKNYLNSKRGE